jgi:hypothetical protein
MLHEDCLEESALGAEGPEEGDFIDPGFVGDQPSSGAAKPVLGVDAGSGFKDALAGDGETVRCGHARILVETCVYASTYLLLTH